MSSICIIKIMRGGEKNSDHLSFAKIFFSRLISFLSPLFIAYLRVQLSFIVSINAVDQGKYKVNSMIKFLFKRFTKWLVINHKQRKLARIKNDRFCRRIKSTPIQTTGGTTV